MSEPERVRIVEVGPRDGFQMETDFIPTELKVEMIDQIAEAGVRKVEATSFVSPKVMPQMQDAAAVMARIHRPPGVLYTALVPNLKGLEDAMAVAADSARLVICASESYNRRNVGMSIVRSLEILEEVLETAAAAAFPIELVLGVAFGCPLEGEVPQDRVVRLAQRAAELGIRELVIADSVGLANPRQIARMMGRLERELSGVELALHLHDTRGLGLANVLAAIDSGIHIFDASLGGLGGCPVVSGATGNIATEDLVNLCEEMGIATGIDLAKLRRVSRKMQGFLGRELPGHLLATPARGELFGTIARRPQRRDLQLEESTAQLSQQGRLAEKIQDEREYLIAGLEAKKAEIEAKNVELELQNAEMRFQNVELEAKNAEVEAKTAEIEQFTYAVSHDLKSPLITILGFVGMVEQDAAAGKAERMTADLARIRGAAEQMQRMLEELLELFRVGRLDNEPTEIAMSELAFEAVELVSGRIAERGVRVGISPHLPAVVGDRPRLLQVFQNLVDNAIKFSGDQAEPEVEIGSLPEDGETVFFVRDHGLGIAPEHREKVFGLFEKLDGQREGSGIGLAIVKRIVEVHGGRVWVESEGPGHGSTFCFTLPKEK